MQEVATDDTFASDSWRTESIEYFATGCREHQDQTTFSAYDQDAELLQNAFSDYFQGQVDYDKGKIKL